MCPSADIPALQSATAPSSLAALVSGLRVRQWAKNLLLFAGLLFAAKLGDGSRWVEAGAAFVAYCLASSAAYLFNDVRDVQEDRLHPAKSRRPIASGSLSPSVALSTAASLLAVAVAITAVLGVGSLGFLIGFAALQLAYSLVLKRLAFVDALAIAGLFVLRAAAGAEAVSVRISVWLLVCTALLALFLALAKRRAELLLVQTNATPGRTALSAYSSQLLNRLVLAAAVSATVAYSVYAFTTHDSFELATTIPFVAFAIARYVHLVVRDGVGEEPERVLLGDVPILAAAAAWALTCGLTLSLS